MKTEKALLFSWLALSAGALTLVGSPLARAEDETAVIEAGAVGGAESVPQPHGDAHETVPVFAFQVHAEKLEIKHDDKPTAASSVDIQAQLGSVDDIVHLTPVFGFAAKMSAQALSLSPSVSIGPCSFGVGLGDELNYSLHADPNTGADGSHGLDGHGELGIGPSLGFACDSQNHQVLVLTTATLEAIGRIWSEGDFKDDGGAKAKGKIEVEFGHSDEPTGIKILGEQTWWSQGEKDSLLGLGLETAKGGVVVGADAHWQQITGADLAPGTGDGSKITGLGVTIHIGGSFAAF